MTKKSILTPNACKCRVRNCSENYLDNIHG